MKQLLINIDFTPLIEEIHKFRCEYLIKGSPLSDFVILRKYIDTVNRKPMTAQKISDYLDTHALELFPEDVLRMPQEIS